MDASAKNVNLTVDDFDSVVAYSTISDWTTPDPSSASFDPSSSPWWMGTYHKTRVLDTAFSFNFTGPTIYVYGASGPTYGSYEVQLDGVSTQHSAYAATNASSPFLLYGSESLAYSEHTLMIRNLGAKEAEAGNELLFDSLITTIQMGPSEATIANTTMEETDASLAYTGVWGNNKSNNFSGGGTTYTNADGASVSLRFHASAIYVFGDKKNDHGLYQVTLDNNPTQTFTGVSGCGGAFAMTCEQQQPTLKFFGSNLGSDLHTLKIQNIAGVNNSFFDLDSIVLTVPSVYAPRDLSTSTTTTAAESSLTSSPTPSSTSGNFGHMNSPCNPLLFFLVVSMWLFKQ